ncbi:MAG: hypothetical protein IPM24_12555 [Bryobacterales bacterium]|nr:hypothetical protein [Bryobacterales bacterium]
MDLDLDVVKQELLEYLATEDFVVFRGYPSADAAPPVFWDIDTHPDFHAFLHAARSVGSRMIVFAHRTFTGESLDEAEEQLKDSMLGREERRSLEGTLRDLRRYVGKTCGVEMSFFHDNHRFTYDLEAEWYEEFLDVLDVLDETGSDENDDTPLGGFYSNN